MVVRRYRLAGDGGWRANQPSGLLEAALRQGIHGKASENAGPWGRRKVRN